MAFTWPVGKIDLINRALAATGNNLVAVLDDGSDEYAVCSPAYEDGLAALTEESNWAFATKVAILTPSNTAPTDTDWDTAYPLPADLVHIVWVKTNQNTDPSVQNLVNQFARYDILAGQLVINAQGGPPPPSSPVTPVQVTMKYVSSDHADPTSGTPLIVRALTLYVMSGIYRGLHGDAAQADRTFVQAEAIAQRARSRYDMQKPKRSLWNSRISRSRLMGRPWPTNGNNGWN
jgi:hypothetical protein